MLSSASDESLILRVGEGDSLEEKTNEFLSDLGKGRVEVEAVRDSFDVSDLHGEGEGSEGFIEDGSEELAFDGSEEIVNRHVRVGGEGLDAPLRSFSNDSVRAGELPDERLDELASSGRTGEGEILVARFEDVLDDLADERDGFGRIRWHILEHEE